MMAVFMTLMLTDIVAHQFANTLMIAHRHPPAANATDHQALEQGRTLSRRAVATVLSIGLSAGAQLPTVVLVLLPTDVSGMGVWNQGMPILLRHRLDSGWSVESLAGLGTSEDKSTGVPRVAQHLNGASVTQWSPDQLTFVDTPTETAREGQIVLVKVLHDGQGRSLSLVYLEEGV